MTTNWMPMQVSQLTICGVSRIFIGGPGWGMTALRLQTRSSIQSQERNLVKSSHCFTKATKQDSKVLSVPKDFKSPTKCHIHYACLVYIYRCNTYRLCLYYVYIIYSVAFRLCRPLLLENPCSEFASFASLTCWHIVRTEGAQNSLKAEIGKWLYEKADGCEASLQRSGKNHRLEISSIILMISPCFPSQIPSGWWF